MVGRTLGFMAERLSPEPSAIREMLQGIPIIDARAIRKVYDTGPAAVEALRGVDIIVAPGEFLAIIGPSGGGKTTLLNCLSGLDEVTGGEIMFEGASLASMSDNQRTDLRARRIGFIFQSFNLLPMLTAEENVELPLLIAGLTGKRARWRSREALERVGLSDRARHRPAEMSGGEQQRVAIARAIVHEPRIVFADEPTGALDSKTSHHVVELLLDLNSAEQTIVMVTHDASLAARAGRVVRMEDGRITS